MILGREKFPNDYEGIRSLLEKGRLFLPSDFGNWSSAVTGSGAVWRTSWGVYISTGTTASSTARIFSSTYGLNPATTTRNYIDWDKKLLIAFAINRQTSEAETTAYLQLKEVETHGNLAAKGLGVVISNLTLSGESYGTERGTTTATQVMTTHRPYTIVIVFDPATPSCSWYINGTLLETVTTAAKLPTGTSGADASIVLSIGNGVTGGTAALVETGTVLLWQAM